MGRRKRNANSYQRRAALREPYDIVLIVCEGTKTEPKYFEALKFFYRLSSANIKIVPSTTTDPLRSVLFAEKQLEAGDYDCVFCVFDRDSHGKFDVAVKRIEESDNGNAGKIRAIISWPCFELWLLLHFKFTTKPYNAAGSKSSGDRVTQELKRHYPTYRKGMETVFADTQPLLSTAIRNAKSLTKHNLVANSPNPATKVHLLVEYLRDLKSGAQTG